ncbi:PREDICTED: farnesyl pyrophosphate synthase-like [Rhagoletis zephyria]|uniref:farnesyl pyrophosphate synthase-like n=1 Tax=Rhagoletis zephyria TaxID=28612 RepID=UPI00081199A9|nr:PREDICTED: farnesyl pyrophosphate synthase-like [Rhagoletis zephyria]
MEKQVVPFEIVLPELKEDIEEYMAAYPEILRELVEAAKYDSSDDAAEWFQKCLIYNNPGSKKHMFGVVAVVMYKSIIPKDQLTPEKLKLIHYLGWCVELFHSALYITDDVVDQSTTRRGQLCWYKLDGPNYTVTNDILMMENAIYKLLRKHFSHMDFYLPILELFHDLSFQAVRGQLMDYLSSQKSVSTFNMKIYQSTIMDKAGCHILWLPSALALHLAGVKDPKVFNECQFILQDMSCFYQEQNDYLDVFVHADITGKIGSDIESNKCSWLAVTCMQQANPEQKAIMVECYGQKDPKKIARVKQLYEEMNLPSVYQKFEREKFKTFQKYIEQTTNGVPKEALIKILKFTMKDDKVNKL